MCLNIALAGGYLAWRRKKEPVVVGVLLGTGVLGFQAGVRWVNAILLQGVEKSQSEVGYYFRRELIKNNLAGSRKAVAHEANRRF